MKKNLKIDYNLRGYAFEYIAKVMLRREHKNNFIFNLSQFDSHTDILNKYRLNPQNIQVSTMMSFFDAKDIKADIIEFILDNTKDRNIQDIILYEVKTMNARIQRGYFEICASNFKFYNEVIQKFGTDKVKIVSIFIYDNWVFSFNEEPYEKGLIKTYSNHG